MSSAPPLRDPEAHTSLVPRGQVKPLSRCVALGPSRAAAQVRGEAGTRWNSKPCVSRLQELEPCGASLCVVHSFAT